MTLGDDVDMDGTSDLAGERDRHKVGAELRRVRTRGRMSLSELGRQVHYTKWFAFDFGRDRCVDQTTSAGFSDWFRRI